MTTPDNEGSAGRLPINEGIVKKGGVNKPPATTRPAPPAGQGGSDSANQGGSGSSSQGGSSEST